MKNQTKTAAGNHFYLVADMKISFINDIPDLTTYVRISISRFQIFRILFTVLWNKREYFIGSFV